MPDLIFDLLALIAVVLIATYGVTASVLFANFRMRFAFRSKWRRQLIYCPVCSGFWIALVAALFHVPPTDWWDSRWFDCWTLSATVVLLVKERVANPNYAAEWAVLDAAEASAENNES